MQAFTDERDAGAIFITHFTLLLGLALPQWVAISLQGQRQVGLAHGATAIAGNPAAAAPAAVCCAGGGPAGSLLLSVASLSGLVVAGLSDAAASVVGTAYGHKQIHAGSKKTWEGAAGGAAAALAGWAVLLPRPAAVALGSSGWFWLAAAGGYAALFEASTTQLDNALVPLWHLPHCMLAASKQS